MGVSRLGGGDDIGLAGFEVAKRNVLADRAAKQMNNLANVSNLFPQRAPRYRRDVLAVDQDAAAVNVVKAQQQIEHRRLAAARWADKCGELPSLGDKTHAAQAPACRHDRRIARRRTQRGPSSVPAAAGHRRLARPAGLSITS